MIVAVSAGREMHLSDRRTARRHGTGIGELHLALVAVH